jgi:AAA+ superfamily predicted ATPase
MSSEAPFVCCPDSKFLLGWKAFLAVGNRLDRLLSSDDEIDIPADEELASAFPILKSPFKRDNVSEPASKELIDILQKRDLFPFLQGAIPLSCVAAIAILAFKFTDKGKQGVITDILRLFRVLGIPAEEHQDEWRRLNAYADADCSYLDMAVDTDSPARVLVLNKEGFSRILGVNIEKSISEELVSLLALKHGMTPIFTKKVAAAKIARKKRKEADRKAEIPKTKLSDVVLYDSEAKFKLEYLVGFRKKRKDGVLRLLLYGPPGTGKTLTAKAIAGELRVPLVTMEISQTFNQFIGETERNIARYFEEVEEKSGILLIDEADSFLRRRDSFSRRWELSEVNTTLSALENSRASVILCTNLYETLDEAVLRRIQEIIEFKMPSKAARYEIWAKELAKYKLKAEVDIEALASIELSGGLIASAVKRAHMMEAVMSTDFNLTTELLLGLANDERRKLSGQGETSKKILGFGR